MKRQWSRGEKWLMLGSGCACFVTFAVGWAYQYQNQLPPPPAYVAEVPPDNDAFDLLTQAVVALPPMPATSTVIVDPTNGTFTGIKPTDFDGEGPGLPKPYTAQYNKAFPLAKKTAYLKSSQKALALWRQSIDLPVRLPYDIYHLNSRHSKIWQGRGLLTSTALVQARACWQQGDSLSALKWLLAAHRDSCREASTFDAQERLGQFGRLQGTVGGRGQMTQEIQKLMPSLHAVELRYAAKELERNRKMLPSKMDALNATLSGYMARVHRWCAGNDITRAGDNERYPSQSKISSTDQLRFRWANKKSVLKRVQEQCDWIVAQAGVRASKRRHRYLYDYPDDVELGYDPILRHLSFPNISSTFVEIERVEAQEIVLMTAMAARAFELERGRGPRELSELVPGYLQKTENDPFAPTQPLRYSPAPQSYIRWTLDRPFRTLPLPDGYVPIDEVQRRPYGGFTGYRLTQKKLTLPFVLYSVGENGQDEGGMDFKRASAKPGAHTGWPAKVRDDVLAVPEWFNVSAIVTTDNAIPSDLVRP